MLLNGHVPKLSRDFDLNGHAQGNGAVASPKANKGFKGGSEAVSVLEAKANGC